MAETNHFTLPNGLRIVCLQSRGHAEVFGVTVNAGSRDETPSHQGLAHFVEHTVFKGTTHRRAHHIINRMEAVGGELNAFTTKEETTVYTLAPNGNLSRSAELVADLVQHSVFPAAELAREREVVRDEIDSYLDTPSEAVFDEFETLFFAGSPLAHNILGDSQSLDSFTSEICRDYIADTFTADRMVVFYQGRRPLSRVVEIVSRYFSNLKSSGNGLHRTPPPYVSPFSQNRELELHQAHTVMGAPLPGIESGQRPAIALLANILGGPGMNSRLNVALRERRGLVYSVEASANFLSDCGVLNIYYGCDPSDSQLCREITFAELNRLCSAPLSSRALAAAKKQYLGQLTVAAENLEHTALSAARATLLLNRTATASETAQAINALTQEQISEAARLFAPELFSALTLH